MGMLHRKETRRNPSRRKSNRRPRSIGDCMIENKQFGDVCDYIRGITYDKEQEQIGSTLGIPVFRSNNIDLDTSMLNFNDVKYVDDSVRVNEKQWLKAGDILITAANGSKKHIGKVALIKNDMPYTFGGFMAVIRSKDRSQLSNQYLFYIMQSHYFRDFLAEQLSATTIQNLNASVIAPMMFPVPPLPEQERIASILGDLDVLIEKQEALIEKKQRLREKVSNDLLLGVRRLPEYVDDVQNRTIGSLGYIYGGLSNKTSKDFENGNASFITFVNVLRNTIIDPKQMGTVNVSRGENQNAVQYGDLLLNGSSETPEETAMCAVFLEHKDNIYLNSFCFGFHIQDQNINPLYMSYYINIALRDEIALISPGSTRHNLNKDSFKKLEFRCPSKAEQDTIADILFTMDEEINELISSAEKNRRLKAGLLRKLIIGEIRVAWEDK